MPTSTEADNSSLIENGTRVAPGRTPVAFGVAVVAASDGAAAVSPIPAVSVAAATMEANERPPHGK